MVPRTTSLRARSLPLAHASTQLERLARVPVEPFDARILRAQAGPLTTAAPDVLQLNLGKVCNQTCRHCHVDAGPDRTEVMTDAVFDASFALLERARMRTLDLTGGAPELHPRFREAVERGRALGAHVMDRSNLTILRVPKYRELPAFLAAQRVEIVASLPSFTASRTDAQRGDGVFDESIAALRALNELGYGVEGSGLLLTLVANPVGTYLSAPQAALEVDCRRELERTHGIVFTRLFSIQNMPISRYLEFLEERGQTDAYVSALVRAFNPAAVASVMCRGTISVGWDGQLYDCDFNQMLDMSIGKTVFDVLASDLDGRTVKTAAHCYGCTAGGGSSCGGALT